MFSGKNISFKTKLYIAYVRPIIEYAAYSIIGLTLAIYTEANLGGEERSRGSGPPTPLSSQTYMKPQYTQIENYKLFMLCVIVT